MKPYYIHELKRWSHKGSLRRWSNYVLGRRATQAAFLRDGKVTVSAYNTSSGVFFSDPVTSQPGPSVLYRVRVTMKPQLKKQLKKVGAI